jgi:gliding motility-associated protein GldC
MENGESLYERESIDYNSAIACGKRFTENFEGLQTRKTLTMKKTEIKFEIDLDENNVPEKIMWNAKDNGKTAEAKAMILSVWDKEERNTLRIDLWNKEMEVDEMKRFIHQTILTLADSFEKATGEKKMADTMRDFCEYYAEKLEIK